MDNRLDNTLFNQADGLAKRDVLNDASIFKLKHHDYLNHIISQVNKDGFYAARCAQFMQNNHLNSGDLTLIVGSVKRWANRKRLSTSFNHLYGICVFESK